MRSALDGARKAAAKFIAPAIPGGDTARVESLKALVFYYQNIGLYRRLGEAGASAEVGTRPADLEELRNPATLVVEFHAGHMFPGKLPKALPIETENPKIIEPIQKMWAWENFSQRKQAFARWVAIREGFIKVAELEDGRPYKQIIDSRHVLQHETNERGHTERILLQYPIEVPTDPNNPSGEKKLKVYTEEWTKEHGCRVWIGEQAGTDVNNLDGFQPDRSKPLEFWGIDFIPFVWAPFAELVPGLGLGSFEPHLKVIDNADAAATRIDSLLFRYNRAIWGLEGTGVDPSGRPLAPPRVEGSFADSVDSTGTPRLSDPDLPNREQQANVVQIANDPFYRLPAGWTLKSLIAQLDFNAAHDILKGKMDWLRQVLPEMLYYQTEENQSESGTAVRYKLAGAIDRNIEARGNGESAIARADMMQLTIAKKNGIEGFTDIGEFEAGDYEHSFEEREVMPETPIESAAALQAKLANAAMMRQLGYPEEDIAKYLGVEKLEPTEPSGPAFQRNQNVFEMLRSQRDSGDNHQAPQDQAEDNGAPPAAQGAVTR